MPDPMPALSIDSAAIGYDTKQVFRDLCLDIASGRVTALCGPNGCGKSTALKAMRGILPATRGRISLLQRPLGDWPVRELARELAMLSQAPEAPGEMTVRDLVALGRYAHLAAFSGIRAADKIAIERAMHATDVVSLSDRPIGTLSGGQLQRTWLAMVVAQEAPVILLDEPTNHLDIAHALETLTLVRRLCDEENKTIVVVLHDLNLAARFADEIVFFRGGEVEARGEVCSVFTEEVIGCVFGIDCEIRNDGPGGKPFCLARGPIACR